MYTGLVISNDAKIREECANIIENSGDIDTKYIEKIDELDKSTSFLNYLFILISDFDKIVIKKIAEAQLLTPGLSTIFYNHSLNFIELPEIARSSKVKMIIGENRKANLQELLESIKDNFWRKIPYEQLGVDYDVLSPRMKKVMQYIETAPISDCNINAISTYLSISPGYFSQEFKRETNKSFRGFMQKVIDYYENIIFSNVNLPAKNISQILGYSELSSFSRSFKKRKGISPTKFRKMVNI